MHLSMREAIERFIADGASVALEGFTHLIPFAAGHEMIRQGRRDLHLIRPGEKVFIIRDVSPPERSKTR